MPIKVTISSPQAQRISVNDQQRTGVRQIGITSDASLASGTVQSIALATTEGLSQTGSPITIAGTITVSANLATTTQTGVVRLNDSIIDPNTTTALTANMGFYLSQQIGGKVQNTTSIITGNGLVGGGDLSVNRTIVANDASVSVNGVVRLNDTLTSANLGQALTANMGRYLDAKSVPNTRQVLTAGGGVTGGGALTADVTIIASNASLTVNGVVRLEDSLTSTNIGTAATANIVRYLDVYKVPNTRQVLTSGGAITGGGTLQNDLTLTIANASTSVNGVVRLNDSLTSQNTGQALTANMGFYIVQLEAGKVQNTFSITTGNGLLGGGDFTTNRTITANDASTSVNGVVRLNDTLASQNVGQALTANMGFWITSQFVGKVQNTRTISTTSPLAGGGDLTVDRTLSIQAASTTQNGETRLNDTVTSSNNFQAATANVANILARPFTGTFAGLVSNTATNNPTGNGQYLLNASGNWVVPGAGGGGGGGTVTAVTILTGSGLAQTGSTITGAGTYTLTANDASTSVNGVVRLNDTLTSTNTGQAATANIVRYLETKSVQNNRLISTTSPLTGGGDLTADRTLAIQAATTTQNGEVRLNDTLTSANVGQALTANMGRYLDAKSVPNTRQILTAGGAITGGGDLTADRTLVIANASLSVNGVVRLEDSFLSFNLGTAVTANVANALARVFTAANNGLVPAPGASTSKFLRDDATWQSVAGAGTVTGVTIITGSGLAQTGSTITAAGTYTIVANDASVSVNGVVRLNDTLTSTNTGQAATANIVRYLETKSVQNNRLISTTSPLTGGGDLTADRTLAIQAASTTQNGEVRLNDTLTSSNLGQAATANIVRYLETKSVQNNRLISTTSPLLGGGDLTADRTLSIQAATLTQNGEVRLNDTLTGQNTFQALTANMGFWISSQLVGKVQNTRSIATTSPLAGGGTLAADLTLTIGAATLTTNGETRLNDTLTSANIGQALTANMGRYLDAKSVPNTRSVLTTSPLAGGGALTSDLTIVIGAATLTTNGETRLNDTLGSANLGQALTANMGRYLDAKSVPNTRSVLTVGGAITGGGTLVADLTLTIANASTLVNGVVRLQDTLASQNTGQALTANMGFYITQLLAGKVQNTFTISTTSPLTGGGDLTTNRTFAIDAATLVANGEVRLNDTLTSANLGQALTANMGRYLDAKSVPNTRQILTVGGAITGGGTLQNDLTLVIANASLSVNGVVRLEDSLTSTNTGTAATANIVRYLDVYKVPNTRLITTGFGLVGGGDMTVDRVHSAANASLTTNGVVRLEDSFLSFNLGTAVTANVANALARVFTTANNGLVPAPGAIASKFLRDDATWQSVAGAGTVTAVTIITGSGLAQTGSTITAAGTYTIVANDASTSVNGVVRLNDTLTSSNVGQALTANMGRYLDVYKVSNTRLISTTSPLLGGGDLTADRTLTIQAASTTQNGEVRLQDSFLSQNTFQAVTANVANALARIFTSANSGLVPKSPGGSTLFLREDGTWASAGAGGDASLTANGIVRLNDTLTSSNIGQAATANMVRYLDVYKVSNTRLISTTSPLLGGGDLTADRTLSIQAATLTQNGEVRLNDTLTGQNTFQALTANMGFWISSQLVGKVQNTRTISTTSPLTGGGDLTTDRTFAITAASLTTNGEVRLNDTLTSSNLGQAATANIVRYLETKSVQNNRLISTTSPLLGGGDLTADRTLSIQAATLTQNGEVRLNDTLTGQNTFQALTANMGFWISSQLVGKVQNTRTISTTSPLTGGGDLTTDRTFAIQAATLTQNGEVRLNDTLTSVNVGQAATANIVRYLESKSVQNNRLISTTSPLTGGGDLTADRTLSIQAATLTQNGETRLNDTLTSANLGQALTANMGRYLEAKSVPNTRQVLTSGGGVTGGGALTADITIIAANASLTTNGVVRLEDSLTSLNVGTAATANIVRYLDVYKVSNTRTISTTSPLLGGGSLAADRTLSIQAASTTQNGEVRLNDTFLSQNTFQAVTANVANALARLFTTANSGLVPVSPGGTTSFLRADGTWNTPAGGSGGGISNTQDNLWTGNNNFYINDANSSTITRSITIGHGNTGTEGAVVQTGFGTGIRFQLESNNLVNVDAGYIDVLWANPNTQVYGANMSFKLPSGGTAPVEVLRVSNTGRMFVANTGGANPSNVSYSFLAFPQSGLGYANVATAPYQGNDAVVITHNGIIIASFRAGGRSDGSASLAGAAMHRTLSLPSGNTFWPALFTDLNTGTGQYWDSNGDIVWTTLVNDQFRISDGFGRVQVLSRLVVNNDSVVVNTRSILTTSPLSGGGTLAADRTLSIQAATLTQNGEVRLNDTLTSANVGQAATANMIRYLEAKSVQNNRTISTTSPLAGGGALTADLTLTIGAATLTTNGETRLNDTLTSANVGQAATANMIRYLEAKSVQNTRQVLTAGGGVTGGGALTADITIIAANASLTVNGVVRLEDSLTSLNVGTAATANIVRYLDVYKVSNTRLISTTSPLSGGGSLAADRTLSIQAASTTQNGEVRLNDTLTSTNVGQAATANIVRYLETKSVQNNRLISTTSPLTGGGDLTADRTLAIQAASTTQNGEVRLNDTLVSVNTFQALTANQGRALARVFSSTFDGLVPTPGASTGRLLRDDAIWVTVSGTGTVTSIDIRPGEGLSNSGGPITGAGSIWVNTVIFTASTNGAVPKSVTADGTKYLRDDATWQTVSATGASTFDYGMSIAVQRGYYL